MKNWKTTLTGILLGFPLGIDAILTAAKEGAFDHKSGAQLICALAIVVLGAYAKDHNVTGGSKAIIFVICLSCLFSPAKSQVLFKPIPKPSYSTPALNPHFRATALSIQIDSTFQGWRIGGPSVLLALPDLTVFTGVGAEYQHSTYSNGRWYKDWGVGASLYEGGQFAPSNIRAATAVGLNASFLDGFLTIGILYNFTTRKVQGATGPMTQLFPSN